MQCGVPKEQSYICTVSFPTVNAERKFLWKSSLMMRQSIKGDLAMEYADARVEAESALIKRGAQKPFEAMKRELASPMAEFNSARELLEYMNG